MNKKMLGICLAAAVISTGTLGGVVASEVAGRSLLEANAEVDTTGNTYGFVRLWSSFDKTDANWLWASGAGYFTLWIHDGESSMGSWEHVAQPNGVVWNSCESDFGYSDVNGGWGTYRPYWYYDIPASVFEEHEHFYLTVQYYKETGNQYDSNASTFNGSYSNDANIGNYHVLFERQDDGRYKRSNSDEEYLDNSVMFVWGGAKEYHTGSFNNSQNAIDSSIAALALEGLNTCSNSSVNGYEAIPHFGQTFLWTVDEAGAFTGWKDSAGEGGKNGLSSQTIDDYDPSLGADGSWNTAEKDSTVNAYDKLLAMVGLYQTAHPEADFPIE